MASQEELDSNRRTYKVEFPHDANPDKMLAWFRQMGAGLYTAESRRAKPSITFETVGTAYETSHYMLVPWQDAEHLVQQLHGHAQGVSATHLDNGRPRIRWSYASEYDMTDPDVHLPLEKDAKSRWLSILNSMTGLVDDEALMVQWVVRPIKYKELPSSVPVFFRPRRGRYEAEEDKQVIAKREAKNAEPNFAVSLRIAARAETDARAHYLVMNMYKRLAGDRGFVPARHVNQDRLLEAVTYAHTPRYYLSRLTAEELMALVGWPLGSDPVVGVSRDAVRHRAPTSAVLSSRSPLIEHGGGIVLGTSTDAGRERTVAVDYEGLTMHAFVGGASGSGKTSVMANMARQAIEDNHGVIVLDPKGDIFTEVIDNIPRERWKDVIVMDFTDGAKPVGFNILEQGDHRTVIDELVGLFEHKYNDSGVYFRQLMFHGLQTLAEVGGLTFNDLPVLIAPRDTDEERWSKRITSSVKDQELQRFWTAWWKDPKRYDNARSTTNRIWQLIARPETRYMLGQSTSSFQMDDVIRENKILLVNMFGVAGDAAEMLGTILFNSIWSSAQRIPVDRSNLVLMDEFHMFTDVPIGFDEVQALARKYKLSLITATQYPEQLKHEQQQAILNNARNKIILNSEGETARFWGRFFTNGVTDTDISNLPRYIAMTRLHTPSGMSAPFTMKTLAPRKALGSRVGVAKLSMETYGRSVADITTEQDMRRGTGERKMSPQEALRWKLEQEDKAGS